MKQLFKVDLLDDLLHNLQKTQTELHQARVMDKVTQTHDHAINLSNQPDVLRNLQETTLGITEQILNNLEKTCGPGAAA